MVMGYGFGFCLSADVSDYSIVYNLNGGTLTSENPITYKSNTESFILNTPSKEGYTFKGWSGTKLEGDENTTVTIEKGSTGDKEFIANYVPNTYSIRFNANGGTGSMSDQTMTYDESKKLTKNIFTKVGYKFIGWNVSIDGTGNSYLDEEEVSNLTTVNGEVINLYAQWESLPVRYAVQIYGINQDVDENDNVLGLTFGPATGADYNNSYVTHEYVANEEGTYNIEIVTTTVEADGTEVESSRETLLNASGDNVTRTAEQVAQRQSINLHNMSWEEISSVADKTLFEDCMLCGDTKSVELILNDTIKTGNMYNQFGDGVGGLCFEVNMDYKQWNPAVCDWEIEELDLNEQHYGSNARNAGGYSSSSIRATLIGKNEKTNSIYAGNNNLTQDNCLFSCIQEDLRDIIAPKKVKYVTGTSTENYSINTDIADGIWLFSEREIMGTGENSGNELEGIGNDGEAYSKFVEPESKYYIETAHNNATNFRVIYGVNYPWWLRSPDLNYTYIARFVDYNGSIAGKYGVQGNFVIAFGFCLR